MQLASFTAAADQEHLKVSLEAGMGMITIDRPKALNAKNCGENGYHANCVADHQHLCQRSRIQHCLAEMVEAAHQSLAGFVKNTEAAAVLIDSTSDKAFCAGAFGSPTLLFILTTLHATSMLTKKSCASGVCVMAGGDIRDIRRAVLDQPYDRDPPLTHRAARVWSESCQAKHYASLQLHEMLVDT